MAMFTKSTKNEWALITKCGKGRTFRYGLPVKICERQNVTVELMWNKLRKTDVLMIGRVVRVLSCSCLYCTVWGCNVGFLIKFVIIKMKSKQPLTFTCKTSTQIIEPPSCHAVPGPCRSHMSHFSQTHLTFSLCKQCCINPQLYTKQLLFCHVYSHKIAPVLGVNSMT